MVGKRKFKNSDEILLCRLHSFDESTKKIIRNGLHDWYKNYSRNLPWRELTKDLTQNDIAYRVLISEIMLQQTQVKTVIDYYYRWMYRWPTIEDLANESDVQQILSVWSGLGYYNRAKRLYETAKIICNNYNGIIPQNYDILVNNLPGIGEYTAGAICSIAFNKPIPAVDGNVLRIFSRLCGLSLYQLKNKNELIKIITQLLHTVIDSNMPGDFNQCLMDIGATICLSKSQPKCFDCPLKTVCKTYKNLNQAVNININVEDPLFSNNNQDDCYICSNISNSTITYSYNNFPGSVKPKTSPIIHYIALAIEINENKTKSNRLSSSSSSWWLISQRPSKGLLANLWEFIIIDIPLLASHIKHIQTIDNVSDDIIHAYLDMKLENMLSNCIDYSSNSKSLMSISYKETLKHVFSHRIHFYKLYHAKVKINMKKEKIVNYLRNNTLIFGNSTQQLKLIKYQDFSNIAISTSVKKMLKHIKP